MSKETKALVDAIISMVHKVEGKTDALYFVYGFLTEYCTAGEEE